MPQMMSGPMQPQMAMQFVSQEVHDLAMKDAGFRRSREAGGARRKGALLVKRIVFLNHEGVHNMSKIMLNMLVALRYFEGFLDLLGSVR